MFEKKKTLNLKSSYLQGKSFTCKFKYVFSIALCTKAIFFDFKKKSYSKTLSKAILVKGLFFLKRWNEMVNEFKSTLMQIWKSANIFVFTWK